MISIQKALTPDTLEMIQGGFIQDDYNIYTYFFKKNIDNFQIEICKITTHNYSMFFFIFYYLSIGFLYLFVFVIVFFQ